MKESYLRRHGRTGFEMVEEASHLVRRASVGALACYYLGTAPFVAGLLFFWSTMSRSPSAWENLAAASLGMSLLFLWMKGWQSVFTRVILAEWSGQASRVTARQVVNSFFLQGLLQPSALFLLPVAAVIMLPFPWLYAFYQNITALDDGEKDLGTVIRQASQQASLWPRQNTVLLLLFSGFGFFVFLNWTTFCTTVPGLLKTFFGIETMATQSPLSMLNSTMFATMAGLTYLCVDPLLKAGYALRCFYGSSLQTGEDLKTELRLLTRVPAAVVIALLLLGAGQTRGDAPPAATAPGAEETSKTGRELDRTIGEVLKEDKYLWRQAREKPAPVAKKGPIGKFFEQIGQMLKKVREYFNKLARKILDYFLRKDRNSFGPESSGWIAPQLGLLFAALAVVASVLGVVLLRYLKARRAAPSAEASIAAAPVPDIADEYISADQFPEDQWTIHGRELMAKGELRSALRAFYLASLAHLGAANLVTIARGKSNREYEREVKRRGHALPGLLPVFSENVRIFDRAWYGSHEVNPQILESFLANLTKIKSIS